MKPRLAALTLCGVAGTIVLALLAWARASAPRPAAALRPATTLDAEQAGAACALCMQHRCTLRERRSCASTRGFRFPGGNQAAGCACACCSAQCKLARTCDPAWVEPAPARPLQPHAQPPSTPLLGWSIGGGGFRAMAAGMALARTMHHVGLFDTRALAAATASSGGAWLLVQLGLDARFAANVTAGGAWAPPSDAAVGEAMAAGRRAAGAPARPTALADAASIRNVVIDWLRARAWLFAPPSAAEQAAALGGGNAEAAAEAAWLLRLLRTASGALAGAGREPRAVGALRGLLSASVRFGGSWERLVRAMLNSSALAHGPAALAGRSAALRGADLGVQWSALASAYVGASSPSDTSAPVPLAAYLLDEARRPLRSATDVTPLGYVLGGGDGGGGGAGGAGVVAAGVPALVGRYNAQMRHGQVLSATVAPLQPLWGGQPPSAALIAAAASAAGGALASPDLVQAALAALAREAEAGAGAPADAALPRRFALELDALLERMPPGPARRCGRARTASASALLALLRCALDASPLALAGQAVCAQRPAHARARSGGYCEFPSFRLADGAYTDGTAAALAVRVLQARLAARAPPPAAPPLPLSPAPRLRLVLSGSAGCEPARGAPAEACDLSELAQLFAGGAGGGGLEPGAIFTNRLGARQPCAQLFGARWAHVRPRLLNLPAAADGSPSAVYAARALTHTVANAPYGVAGGTPVDVLLLLSAAPLGGLAGALDAARPRGWAPLGDLAQSVCASVLPHVLAAWWGDTGGALRTGAMLLDAALARAGGPPAAATAASAAAARHRRHAERTTGGGRHAHRSARPHSQRRPRAPRGAGRAADDSLARAAAALPEWMSPAQRQAVLQMATTPRESV